jgi:integrase
MASIETLSGRAGCRFKNPLMLTDMDTIASFAHAQRADGYSLNTIKARVRCLRAISQRANVAPELLQAKHVQAYFAERPLRPWSRRTYLNHLQAYGKWLGVDLVQGIRKPPAPRATPNPLPEDDLRQLSTAARGPHRAWILLGAFCGLRAHETAKLECSSFSTLDDGEVILRVTGKGGRTDVVPVPPVVVKALDIKGAGPLWAEVSPERVSRTVARIAARLGIKMRYHQLRHRYGTMVYRASGKDLLLTQRLMRHSSPATTAGYAAVADDQAHIIVHALPGADPSGQRARARSPKPVCTVCHSRT